MRRSFEKSLCKCPRCVARRRIRFLTLSGVSITIAAGCYILVDHSKHAAPPSLNTPEASAEDLASDASAIPRGSWEHASRALPEPETPWKEQDIETTPENLAANGFSTGSLKLKENLTPPDASRNRGALPSSNPIGEAPMPHTNGWQTVPLADASKSAPEVNIQGTSQPSGAKVAAVPAESSPGPTFGEPTAHPAAETSPRKDGEDVLMAYRSDPYELLPRWLKEMQQKSDKTSLSGNELLLQNQEDASGGPESIAAARSATVVEDPKSDITKSKTAEADKDRAPVIAQSETLESTPEAASGETTDGANTDVAATAAVSPAPAHAQTASAGTTDIGKVGALEEVAVVKTPDLDKPLPPQPKETDLASRSTASAGTADIGKVGTPEEVAAVKTPDLDKPLPPQPKETDLASRSKPEEALASGSAGSAKNLASERKEREPIPAETSARLASLESNTVMHSPAELGRKPTGYITVESKPESPQNLGAEDRPPKPQEHPGRVQDHSQKVQDRRQTVQEYPSKAQDHPLKAPDNSSKPEEKSGDLRRFALAFLHSDQTGNVADQQRFYADSVHFYREGDLSWAGVAAATRRYHQERQNKRYGTEGTAAVKGPVDGGFYVVEQPVSWIREEGSRQIRGKSVIRLRVVPTNRGDWRITSIDETRQ
jgi:hypothetical protein